ncbi:MAG: hypothetical protein J5649_08590 [Lachnospiraceae bacterium]|nr:hypothetical protein [Lachnospiraceae bacterium]
MKRFKIVLALILTMTAVLVLGNIALADEPVSGAPVKIYSVDDLLTIKDNPAGTYELMTDIDLNGVEWPAITFTGRFKGNGHYILNLNKAAVSEETRVTYDGNRKTYDTHFAGLFAIAENASITGVRLLGIDLMHNFDGDCFLGGIAGFASETVIENCEVVGSIRLDVDNGRMFGVGGVIGYGNAVIRDCVIDVTLVNTDLDKANRDEQYLGGICGAGYPDIDGCTIDIAGYISDHGYVHSGGMVGMYIIYPKRFDRDGFVKNNTLKGFITFFEDNTNRRAYCVKDFGEVMDHKFSEANNTFDFKRDERKDYSVNLLPHMCDNPDFEDAVHDAAGEAPGYTEHTCKTCGYSYRDQYTTPVHTLSADFNVVTEATVEAPGLAEYTCVSCGAVLRQEIPSLTPTPTPTSTPTPAPDDGKDTKSSSDDTKKSGDDDKVNPLLPIACGILFIVGAVLTAQVILHRRERKRMLARRKQRNRKQ